MKKYSFYERIGRVFPSNARKKIRTLMTYADVRVNEEAWLGFVTVFTSLLFIAVFLLSFSMTRDSILALLVGAGVCGLFAALPHMLISLRGDKRAEFVEKVLPDNLLLIVANIRSGMTPEKSLVLSARDEFGVLSVEIKNAMKRTIAGENFIEALKLISKDINSKVLRRVVSLLVEGVRSGGEIATLLEESAYNIRSNQLMKKEIRSSVLMYVIFLFAAIGVAGPLLYGISSYLVQVMSTLLSRVDIPSEVLQTSFIKLSSPTITPEFVTWFAMLNLTVSCVFGSMIIGMIDAGSAKKGLKFIPIMLAVSLGLYMLIRSLLAGAILL
jgi:flagellar protein FlaJ